MTDKMREAWDAHDKARNKAWREEPGTFDTLDAFKAGAAWQAAKAVPDAELERLRKDAARYLWLRNVSDLDQAIDAAMQERKS